MSLCEFTYTPGEAGYEATCTRCGRGVQSKSRDVYAACRASSDYAETQARIAGVVKGPGSHLADLLKRLFGFTPAGNCPCKKHAFVMDMWGPDECERRIDEIVGWLRDEHARRREAGETRIQWTDFGATQLVRLACRRARAKAQPAD